MMKRIVLFWLLWSGTVLAQSALPTSRETFHEAAKQGMWQDALDLYRSDLIAIDDSKSAEDLLSALECVGQLGSWAEFDELLEQAIAHHPENSAVLLAGAVGYLNAIHHGREIGGTFERGYFHGGRASFRGIHPSSADGIDTRHRDRIRALQLLGQALAYANDPSQSVAVWNATAGVLRQVDSWKLQILTPLDSLPEWRDLGPQGGTEGAPWRKDAPVLFEIPSTWEAATSDGERWRFALAEQARLAPEQGDATIAEYADFSHEQFGVTTLQSFAWWQQLNPDETKGILEIETLKDSECLAKTSDGVKRFSLPEAHHFIPLYRSILKSHAAAGDALVQVYLDRRQYAKARETLEEVIAHHGTGDEEIRAKTLKQITGNWGRFETNDATPHGQKPKLTLTYRNAHSVTFSARPVDTEQILADAMSYLKGKPEALEWQRTDLSSIFRSAIENDGKFLGKVAAEWPMPLSPRPNHREAQATTTMPLNKPGAWWVTAKMPQGNEFHTLVWIVDSVLNYRQVGNTRYWWVADAASGKPIADAELQFFGYRVQHIDRKKPGDRNFQIEISEFQRSTDTKGTATTTLADSPDQNRWLVMARSKGHNLTFYGFTPLHDESNASGMANRDLSFGITDRPLYRLGDTAHFKFFVENVGYGKTNPSKWANRSVQLILRDGRGTEVVKLDHLRTESDGSIEATAILPKNAAQGEWQAVMQIPDELSGSVNFRVEAFRKPEFEVIVDAQSEPVLLGGKFTAVVRANYFHGAPVREASVTISVKRRSLTERWFPSFRWDWLYGPGAWWNQSSSLWHPKSTVWGCFPPAPSWHSRGRWLPEELVHSEVVAIGDDGTATITVDTSLTQTIHGDTDSEYLIEARVVDASRREEIGTGRVIAARKPFEVVVWTDRGFSAPGDTLHAQISAATLSGDPIANTHGELAIFRLNLSSDGKLTEEKIDSWEILTDAEGKATHRFTLQQAGQYRLSAILRHTDGTSVEGAGIINVFGENSASESWRFGPLELITDRATYQPGDELTLRINSDHADAYVWLFIRNSAAEAQKPRLIQLTGKSAEVTLALSVLDQPNFFIEAITTFDGAVHSAVKEVLLPPASRALEVSILPEKSRLKPQERSSVKLSVRDLEGNPVVGNTVVTIYDQALEAITGGSNVSPILAAFWDWKNHYYPRQHASLPPPSENIVTSDEHWMQPLGAFADTRETPFAADSISETSVMQRSGLAVGAAPMVLTKEASPENAGEAPVVVRKDFADLLHWTGRVSLDSKGEATIPIELPDNLTTWKIKVWSLASETRVGEGSAEIIVSKELLVRLHTPRFLTERDEAVFSAVVHNDHSTAKTVRVTLEVDGDELKVLHDLTQTIEIAASSEARIDWPVTALKEGKPTVRVIAHAGDDSDAMELKLPVLVHGMKRQDAWSRAIAPEDDRTQIEIEVPEQRRIDQSVLTVRFSPTIAGAVVDAIPYLVSYPHGCTEQVMNRFVPAVIAQGLLTDLGYNLAEIRQKRTNMNPQELGDSSHRATQWRQWQENPVFDEQKIKQLTELGVQQLMSMQKNDGGWGWFHGYGGYSSAYQTALIVHGLVMASAQNAAVPEEMIQSGLAWLMRYEQNQTQALQRWVDHQAIRERGGKVLRSSSIEKAQTDPLDAFIRYVLGASSHDSEAMTAFLHRDRLSLPVYAKCLLGLEHHRRGDTSRRDELIQLISQFQKIDPENQTVYLELPNKSYWWFWYGSEIEAHAWYLKLLAAAKPKSAEARGLAKYLVNNRKNSSYWNSTRDTAFAIEAIADYFKASGEQEPKLTVDVSIDGKSEASIKINRENLFSFDGTLVFRGDQVTSGKHLIEINKSGDGPLYANAYLEVFSLEDDFRAAGLEVKIQRRLWKLTALEDTTNVPDVTGLVVQQQVEKFDRHALSSNDTIKEGDRVEVELIIESKNDYEHLLISDAKAAGFEAVQVLSGYMRSGGALAAYMEPKDETVNFFIESLPRGTHTLRYELRAETPGTYKALPTLIEAMYAPELRGNSDDIQLSID